MDITPRQMFDGLANLISRLGTTADRNTQSVYYTPLISQDQLENAYRSSWLTRKVHDLVPFEMTRAGRVWQAEKEQTKTLEKYERDLRIWEKLKQALTVARLHGGAAIVLGVRQGMPDQPINPERVVRNSLQYAVVVSRHQLSAPRGFDMDVASEYFMQPQMWEMQLARGGRVEIHPSRVLTFHGAPLPTGGWTMTQLEQFWGDPLLVSIKAAIDNAETSQVAVSTLLHELKQDVIKIPGLTQQIATQQGEDLLALRIAALEKFKSMFNALLLDGGDKEGKGGESWETRELSFQQHPELLDKFLSIVAGASDIPITRLLGQSPGGLQSTGKGEQDDFNRMISAKQDADLAPALRRLDEILIRSALGSRPEEIESVFGPLDEADANELSEIEKREAETVQIYAVSGLVPQVALAKAVHNRLLESGRWPGLDAALEEAAAEIEVMGDPDADEGDPANPDEPTAANENDVQELETRGAVTRDMALALLADASPRTLYVERKLLNADDLIAWAKAQGFETTLPADDMHVTVLYSHDRVDWLKAGTDWNENENGELVVPAGGARIVDQLGNDGAVVLLFNSSRLAWRHEQLMNETGARHSYSDYQPHVTISYKAPAELLERLRRGELIEPYRGVLRFGPERFGETKADWKPPQGEV